MILEVRKWRNRGLGGLHRNKGSPASEERQVKQRPQIITYVDTKPAVYVYIAKLWIFFKECILQYFTFSWKRRSH